MVKRAVGKMVGSERQWKENDGKKNGGCELNIYLLAYVLLREGAQKDLVSVLIDKRKLVENSRHSLSV